MNQTFECDQYRLKCGCCRVDDIEVTGTIHRGDRRFVKTVDLALALKSNSDENSDLDLGLDSGVGFYLAFDFLYLFQCQCYQ